MPASMTAKSARSRRVEFEAAGSSERDIAYQNTGEGAELPKLCLAGMKLTSSLWNPAVLIHNLRTYGQCEVCKMRQRISGERHDSPGWAAILRHLW